jgi:hypothetical protein
MQVTEFFQQVVDIFRKTFRKITFAEKQILQCQKEHVHNDNDLQNTTKQLKIKQHEPN